MALAISLGASSANAADRSLHVNGLNIDARPLPTSNVGVIERPGTPNWWTFDGRPVGAEGVSVQITPTRVPAGCSSQPPFQVSEYNAEGHFIKMIPPQGRVSGFYDLGLRYPGLYLLQVAITDPGCGGIQYIMSPEDTSTCDPAAHCVGAKAVYHASADVCSALSANVTGATLRLQASRKARHRNPALIRQLAGKLASARDSYSNGSCATHA